MCFVWSKSDRRSSAVQRPPCCGQYGEGRGDAVWRSMGCGVRASLKTAEKARGRTRGKHRQTTGKKLEKHSQTAPKSTAEAKMNNGKCMVKARRNFMLEACEQHTDSQDEKCEKTGKRRYIDSQESAVTRAVGIRHRVFSYSAVYWCEPQKRMTALCTTRCLIGLIWATCVAIFSLAQSSETER